MNDLLDTPDEVHRRVHDDRTGDAATTRPVVASAVAEFSLQQLTVLPEDR
ncbi:MULTISPECIES: hypothetical protein [Pseudonocardia]|uniref:Uncharacterized protein n=2 Tax=Pseudonocardia TaxID=1847 RepID=A0A1Y2MSP5_PSEAH|nr:MULTISPECIES: hypothetical protein [Pseudonocardia]OSY38151.1 hypothetical protein BG845_04324 [Pseudonocardia autotrophica]TDN75591.1 hypothetical protein C8E95_4769 [Pseudonocardia autotrophica]BBF99562.1 hypothetical protein Pdca_07720 [Pseudonocardia autotrophica]GEC27801.1 hypothetical protein PSA01_48300 [Pseudonocardia saturnea]